MMMTWACEYKRKIQVVEKREERKNRVIGDFEGRRKRNVISRRLQYAKGIEEGCRGHQRYGNTVITDYRQK